MPGVGAFGCVGAGVGRTRGHRFSGNGRGVCAGALCFGVLAPFALVLRWAVNLLIWGLILYVIAGFFGPRYIGYQSMLSTLVDPFLRPIRRVLPRIAGLDFSPALLFLILCVLLRLVTPASMGFWML